MLQNETKSKAIIKALRYTSLTMHHLISLRKLDRVPEPFALTEQASNVEEYSKAFDSVMRLPYILALNTVHRVLGAEKSTSRKALDLCCGPGHFTRMLVQHLNFSQVTGVDLSNPMLSIARQNASHAGLLKNLNYVSSDVADLKTLENSSMDLVSFMDGAHHMPSLDKVTQTLKEAERVTKPEGCIVVLDPVRPKTQWIADLYHKIAGQSYLDQNLVHFNQDFRDSLFASWSVDELFQTIPSGSKRRWVQLIPFGFPAFQILIGLPEGRNQLFLNKGLPASLISSLLPNEGTTDWKLLNLTFRLARKRARCP